VTIIFEFSVNSDVEYGVRPFDNKRFSRWYKQFRVTGGEEKRHSTGWPKRSDED
jgi:hypothetical protein